MNWPEGPVLLVAGADRPRKALLDTCQAQQADTPPLSRRAWLTTVARYGTLAGLLGSLGVLAARGQCTRAGTCTHCPKFANCDLSQATATRRQNHKEHRT